MCVLQVYAWIAKPEVEWLNLPRSNMYQARNQNSGCSAAPVESTSCLWGFVWCSGLEMVVVLGCGSVCLMGFWCRTSGESALVLVSWGSRAVGLQCGTEPSFKSSSRCVWLGWNPWKEPRGAKSGSASTGSLFVFPCQLSALGGLG